MSTPKVTGTHETNADYQTQGTSGKNSVTDKTTTEGAAKADSYANMKNRFTKTLSALNERDPTILKKYFGNKTAQVMEKGKWYKRSDKKTLKENVEQQIFHDLYEEVRTDKKPSIDKNLSWSQKRAVKNAKKQEIKNNKKELKELFKKELSEGSLQGLRKTISDTVDQRSEEIKNVRKKDSRWGIGGGIGFGALGAGIAAGLCYLTGVGAPIGAAITIITALIAGIGAGKGVHHAMKTNRQTYNNPDAPDPSITLDKVLSPQDQKTGKTSSTSKVDKEKFESQSNFSDKGIANYACENNCSVIKLGKDKTNLLKDATLFANFGKSSSGKTVIQKVHVKADEDGTPYFEYTIDNRSLVPKGDMTQIVKKGDKRYDKFMKALQEAPVFAPAEGGESSKLLPKKLNMQTVLGKFKENAVKSNPDTKATDQPKPTTLQNSQGANPTAENIAAENTTTTNPITPTTAKDIPEISATNAVNDTSKAGGHQFACPMLKEMSEAVDYCTDLNTEVEITEVVQVKVNGISTDKETKRNTIQAAKIFYEITDKISEKKEALRKNQRLASQWESMIQNYENTKTHDGPEDDKTLTEAKKEFESLKKQIQEDKAYVDTPKKHLEKIVILTRPYGSFFQIKGIPDYDLDSAGPDLALAIARGQGVRILIPHKEEISLNLQNCDEAYTKLEIPGKLPEEANKIKDKLFEKLWNEDSKAATDIGREQYINQKISNIKEKNTSLKNVNEDQLRAFIGAILELKGE